MSGAAVGKPTEVSPDPKLADQARRLDGNISRACARGLEAEVAAECAGLWREENAEAMASSNAFADKNGIPLAALRQL